jgi:hypothetical protein
MANRSGGPFIKIHLRPCLVLPFEPMNPHHGLTPATFTSIHPSHAHTRTSHAQPEAAEGGVEDLDAVFATKKKKSKDKKKGACASLGLSAGRLWFGLAVVWFGLV